MGVVIPFPARPAPAAPWFAESSEVQLNSGGPTMTVLDCDNGKALCGYWLGDKPIILEFDTRCLVEIRRTLSS